MFTNTQQSAPANGNLSSISSIIAEAKSFSRPMQVDVLCGDIDRFIDRLNREIGMVPAKTVTGTVAGEPKATFAGVPVVENDILPANMVVVKVNGEIAQIIRFD